MSSPGNFNAVQDTTRSAPAEETIRINSPPITSDPNASGKTGARTEVDTSLGAAGSSAGATTFPSTINSGDLSSGIGNLTAAGPSTQALIRPTERLTSDEHAAKARLLGWEKQQPRRGRHEIWKAGFFKIYAMDKMPHLAVCMLCLKAGRWSKAEVNYGAKSRSTTNLLQHLNSRLPGHSDVYKTLAHVVSEAGGDHHGTDASLVTNEAKEIEHLCRWIVALDNPLAMVDDKAFRKYQTFLKRDAKILSRKSLLEQLRAVEERLRPELTAFLQEQHLCMTHGTWTDSACRTFMSTTYAFIDASWKMWAVSPCCSVHLPQDTGEELTTFTENVVTRNGHIGRVIAVVTDCEPSMVKAGRLLEGAGTIAHVGCTDHRLQLSGGKVFTGEAVLETLARLREVVARYKSSSQAAELLRQTCVSCGVKPLQVVQDAQTRWCSTYASIDRLLYLKRPIQNHEVVYNVNVILKSLDWAILEKLHRLLAPLSVLLKMLEGERYVNGSLIIPLVKDLRDGTNSAVEACAPPANPAQDATLSELERKSREALRPCVNALLQDINTRWGDGMHITWFREGPRRQPQGFTRAQLLAMVCDPRLHENLHGIPEYEHLAVWEIFQKEVTALALRRAGTGGAEKASAPPLLGSAIVFAGTPDAASAGAIDVGAGDSSSASASKKSLAKAGLFAISRSSEGELIGAPPARMSIEAEEKRIIAEVAEEVKRYRDTQSMALYHEGSKGNFVFNDPLPWWATNCHRFPRLAVLARRVLAIPATLSQSDRLFPASGQIVTKDRGSLGPDNAETILFLRTVWPVMDAVRKGKSSSAAKREVHASKRAKCSV